MAPHFLLFKVHLSPCPGSCVDYCKGLLPRPHVWLLLLHFNKWSVKLKSDIPVLGY
jgi:hypothetical protein